MNIGEALSLLKKEKSRLARLISLRKENVYVEEGKKTEFDLKNCIEKLCEYVEARYLQLKANKIEKINEDYLNCLYQINEWADYEVNSEKIRGKIIGVSQFGKLEVQIETGTIKEFDLKEIVFLRQ